MRHAMKVIVLTISLFVSPALDAQQENRSLLPRLSLLPESEPGQPSVWQRLEQGSKNLWTKTIDVLTLRSIRQKYDHSYRVTGVQKSYPGSAREQEQRDEPVFPLLWPWSKPEPPAPQPRSVQEWLRQPRVPY